MAYDVFVTLENEVWAASSAARIYARSAFRCFAGASGTKTARAYAKGCLRACSISARRNSSDVAMSDTI